jgi:hypothetical protein
MKAARAKAGGLFVGEPADARVARDGQVVPNVISSA